MRKTFIVGIDTKYDDFSDWLIAHNNQIRAEEEDERANLLAFICKKYNIPLVDMNCTVMEWEELKEHK